MKKLTILLFFISSISICAQNWTAEHHHFDTNYKMMKGYYNRGLYQEATHYIDSLLSNSFTSVSDYYFFARIYSLNNEFDKTLHYLELAVKGGIKEEQITKMYDLDKFRESRHYMLYEINYPKWRNQFLSQVTTIDSTYLNEIRLIKENYNKSKYIKVSESDGDLIYQVKEDENPSQENIDSISFYSLAELIKTNGFPTISKVGYKGTWWSTLILENYIEGFNTNKDWQYVKKEIKKGIKEKKIKPFYLARLKEEYLLKMELPIEYAIYLSSSRLQSWYEKVTIQNPEELNLRRESIGLCSVQVEVWSNAMDLPKNLQNVKFK